MLSSAIQEQNVAKVAEIAKIGRATNSLSDAIFVTFFVCQGSIFEDLVVLWEPNWHPFQASVADWAKGAKHGGKCVEKTTKKSPILGAFLASIFSYLLVAFLNAILSQRGAKRLPTGVPGGHFWRQF